MPKSIREQLVESLIARGSTEIESKRTPKSWAFTCPGDPESFLYLGRSGSLRKGKNRETSIPVNRLKAALLTENGQRSPV